MVVLGILLWGKVHHARGGSPPEFAPREQDLSDMATNVHGRLTLPRFIVFLNRIGWLLMPVAVVVGLDGRYSDKKANILRDALAAD